MVTYSMSVYFPSTFSVRDPLLLHAGFEADSIVFVRLAVNLPLPMLMSEAL